ncbi:Oligopeptide transport ATP-binding protein OppF [Methanosarcina sp. MTP4]|uniref:oligopeptide/dipeptide ABC transporter ATP-binding protein n=1 Tax=Methanosarcina sp. MTP4 TaxID=1434100 RepID=UPI00061598A3|nr:ABC transporter ATP-binding protein [Methanosarcina sp. MTP4]AKB23816.1 Oligopeptide transport ATP-binding protein OppF [Methanosarcina sp. MTP4]
MLEVRGLKKYFSSGHFKKEIIKAVDDISFEVREGKTLGLVGESGSGKSTVGRCILRFTEPDSGIVSFEGKDLAGLTKKEFSKVQPRMQMIFQDPYSSLDPKMKLKTSISEPLRLQGVKRKAAYAEVPHLLETVGLSPEHENRYPHQLSGGQNQRAAIARALALRPKFLIADEITASLDVSVQAQILHLIKNLKEEHSLGMLFISHDLEVVRYMCDRVAVMYAGKVLEIGAVEEVFSHPQHPYTRQLLSDKIQEQGGKEIRGPDFEANFEAKTDITPGFEGCVFYAECPYADPECRAETPKMLQTGRDHSVRCKKLR